MEPSAPTVHDVLAHTEIQRGHPMVLAGRTGLHREVSWVHVMELPSIAGRLRGGELVLLTGVALPESNDGLRSWIDDLAAMGASAVMLQLGERWTTLPTVLVRAADRVGLPLIGLHTLVPFVDITRSVLSSIVHSSYAQLELTARVHELFHRMAVDGLGDLDVVTAVSGLTGASVVLENRTHQVLAYMTPPELDSDTALRDWERRSRRDGEGETWIIGEVRARGQSWGRLIAQLGPDRTANRIHRLVVPLGAENIALRRMIEGDGVFVELEARSELLSQLAHGHYRYEADGRLRAEAAGFPMTSRTLVALAVAAPGTPPDEIRQAVARAASEAHLQLLMGRDNAGLLSVPPDQDPRVLLHSWSERLRRDLSQAVIGIGAPVTRLTTIRAGLLDATSAARAGIAGGTRRPVVALADVRVRGLLAQLVHDPRLQAFVERELGSVLNRDQAAELAAVRAYLEHGRNKSAAAQAVQISRPAFYARLQRAADLLEADLEDAETCLSLQLALLGLDLISTTQERVSSRAAPTRPGPRGPRGPQAWPVVSGFDPGPRSDVETKSSRPGDGGAAQQAATQEREPLVDRDSASVGHVPGVLEPDPHYVAEG